MRRGFDFTPSAGSALSTISYIYEKGTLTRMICALISSKICCSPFVGSALYFAGLDLDYSFLFSSIFFLCWILKSLGLWGDT